MLFASQTSRGNLDRLPELSQPGQGALHGMRPDVRRERGPLGIAAQSPVEAQNVQVTLGGALLGRFFRTGGQTAIGAGPAGLRRRMVLDRAVEPRLAPTGCLRRTRLLGDALGCHGATPAFLRERCHGRHGRQGRVLQSVRALAGRDSFVIADWVYADRPLAFSHAVSASSAGASGSTGTP